MANYVREISPALTVINRAFSLAMLPLFISFSKNIFQRTVATELLKLF